LRAGIVGLVALVAAGCGGGETAAEMSDELHFVRSGGLAGEHDELTIQPDGQSTLTVRGGDEEQFQLSDDELDDLQTALDGSGLEDAASDSTSEQPAPDAFSYVITYGDKEVRTDDPSVPDELKDLLVTLDGIVEAHRPR
jgi:hypothetical protein